MFEPCEKIVFAFFGAQIGEEKWSSAALDFGIGGHHFQISTHIGREVGFVDQQQVAGADGWATFAWDFIALGDIDDVDVGVDEFGRKGRREIVAATFDEDELQIGVSIFEIDNGGHVHAGVVADRRVRTASCLDAAHSIGGQDILAQEKFGIFAGVDVIGDDGERDVILEPLAQAQHAHGFSGTYRATNAEAEGAFV